MFAFCSTTSLKASATLPAIPVQWTGRRTLASPLRKAFTAPSSALHSSTGSETTPVSSNTRIRFSLRRLYVCCLARLYILPMHSDMPALCFRCCSCCGFFLFLVFLFVCAVFVLFFVLSC